MNSKIKCIEYYFDSRLYNKEDVIENMKKEKMEFPKKKKSEVDIHLNEFGIYVAQLQFVNNEIAIVKDKKISKSKKSAYGQYKETKKFYPI